MLIEESLDPRSLADNHEAATATFNFNPRRVGDGYIGTAQMTGSPAIVPLAGIWSPLGAEALTVDSVGRLARVYIAANGGLTARPIEVLRYNAAGLSQGRLVHQNSLRLTWLQAYALSQGVSEQIPYPASALREDLAGIRRYF
jgi:hypothetical protein